MSQTLVFEEEVLAFIKSNPKGVFIGEVYNQFRDVKCPLILSALINLVSAGKIVETPPEPRWNVATRKYAFMHN